ncbi:hypothetical protein AB0395_27185 [Streptosporangium sp. NPDC051023]|uniref:hypothetical protein n=1 Tax=Streptosporangium sp. NPDC051023 TaxID=3155410 RepID=UPI00344D7CAA
MSRKVRLAAEWALWGKRPDARDDYKVLACSDGMLGGDDFGEIMTRYAPGTPADLPQVTVSWVGGDTRAHLGLAVQEWSDRRDGMGRPIAGTRYFCVPYGQAAAGPVSYEALYNAFKDHSLPVNGPLSVEVPTLDLEAILARADGAAVSAAALLLTDRHVCVVRGESVSMLERLRFLDVVAALLPYGLRAKLAASTWTDSSAKHRIRLSFAKHPQEGAYSVAWGGGDGATDGHDIAARYMDLLARHPLEKVMARFAGKTEPLLFKDAQHQVLALLDEPSSTMPMPVQLRPLMQARAGDLLNTCADLLEQRRYDELEGLLTRLHNLARRLADDERRRCQEIIKVERLLCEHRGLPKRLEDFYDVILAVGYGPQLTAEGVRRISEDADTLSGTLVGAMLRMPPAEPGVVLKLVQLCPDEGQRARALQAMDTKDLVKVVAGEPFDPPTVHLVCNELIARGGGGAEDTAMATALHEHGYLAAAIEAVHQDDGDTKLAWFTKLLVAAYGQPFERAAFKEVLGHPVLPQSAALAAAAVRLYGPGARDVVVDGFCEFLGRARLTTKTLNQVVEQLLPPAQPNLPPERPPAVLGAAPSPRGRKGPRFGRPQGPRFGRPQPLAPGHRRPEGLLYFWVILAGSATVVFVVVVLVILGFR